MGIYVTPTDSHVCELPHASKHKAGTVWQCSDYGGNECKSFYLLMARHDWQDPFDTFYYWKKISRRKAERLKRKAYKARGGIW